MYQYLNDVEKKRLFTAVLTVFTLLAVFLGVKVISEVKGVQYIGQGAYATNVISVTGKGEVLAVPDVGTFSFSVVEDAKTVGEAQDAASKKTNSAIDALKAMGIADKDIKTTGYNSYPKYEYSNSVCPKVADGGASYYCPPGKQVLTGYEVSQSITVKIRKTADAGAVLTKVGSLGVSNISGLDFVVDDMDAVQAEARDKAIADAKAKAKILAKSLGVNLSKIISFNEGGNQPMYYSGAMDSKVMNMAGSVAPTPPQTPVGEDKIVSNITITYEIR